MGLAAFIGTRAHKFGQGSDIFTKVRWQPCIIPRLKTRPLLKDTRPDPDDLLTDDVRASLPARTQTLIAFSALGWSFFAARATLRGDYAFGIVTGVGAACSLAVYATHRARPHWTTPLAHVNAAISTLFIFLTCLISGQVFSASLWYLVCVPLAIGYLHGMRMAGVWAGICSIVVILNHLLMQVMLVPPLYKNTATDFTIGVIVLILLAVGLITGSERVHTAHVAALKKRELMIASLLQGLEKKTEEAEQARDRAVLASRAKGDFVAALSHEIRTPLNGVLGMAGLLLDEEMPAPQRDLVRTIRTSGDALLHLLNDLLDFSKIEAGRLELEKAPFDVRDCVEETFDLLGVGASAKKIRLTYSFEKGLQRRVIGDAGRVRQILVNLVSNAIKFTPQGEVTVNISCLRNAEGTLDLGIAVRDTGIGIAEERVASLFEPFTQADSSTTSKFGGTGLGLAICRRLAEAMNGKAWLESQLGQGSTFHVMIRVGIAPDVASTNPYQLPGKRIVFLSAHEPTRNMVSALLGSLQASVFSCGSLEEARASIKNEAPDAVIAEPAFAQIALETRSFVTFLQPWEFASSGTLAVRAPARRSELARKLRTLWGVVERPSMSGPSVFLLGGALPSVLVVEDNPVNQRVMRLMLEKLGCRPDVAGNGLEALDALRSRKYDVVFMDVRMPEMDGISATRIIRRDLPTAEQPLIVAMTANVQVEDRMACESAGMDDFLPKPIRPADLVRAMERAQAQSLEAARRALES